MKAGNVFLEWRNQAWRECEVLAVLGDKAIVEYEMPAGSSQLLVGPVFMFGKAQGSANDNIKPVSYGACPKKWRKAILEQSGSWIGKGQSQPRKYAGRYQYEIEAAVLEI